MDPKQVVILTTSKMTMMMFALNPYHQANNLAKQDFGNVMAKMSSWLVNLFNQVP